MKPVIGTPSRDNEGRRRAIWRSALRLASSGRTLIAWHLMSQAASR